MDSDDEQEYELESFDLGEFTLTLTTIAYLPITKLMSNRQKNVEISGQKLWCGSLCLLQYLINTNYSFADQQLLELGAGTGLLGMSCNKLGAKRVILTDNDVQSLTHMQVDCERNAICATIKLLDWFCPPEEHEVSTFVVFDGASANTHQLLVLAGDVLYMNSLLTPFFTCAKLFLSKVKGEMLLCHIPRAGVEHANVQSAAQTLGFRISVVDIALWNHGVCLLHCPPEDSSRAQIYTLSIDL